MSFSFWSVRSVYVPKTKTADVQAIYRSEVDPRLVVIDKKAGGSKADAVNAGLNATTSPYVCVVDSDSLLERDALLRIMLPVLSDPKHVVAVGGIIRVLNGSEIKGGQLTRVRLPRKWIEAIQVVEYLRAFLIGREAFGASKHADDHFKECVLAFSETGLGARRWEDIGRMQIGEDFDLVARLHRYLLQKGADYRIQFVPDPMCWTEAPSDLKSLGRQRARWQKRIVTGSLGQPGHAVPVPLWKDWILCVSLFVVVRADGTYSGGWGNFHDCSGCVVGGSEPGIVPAIPDVWICVCDGDFDWIGFAGRNYVQAV